MRTLDVGETLGQFRLTRLLRDAEGRRVFAAEDAEAGARRVIIKTADVANSADAARLQREYDVLLATRGPGVVEAIEHGVSISHQTAYLVLADHGVSLAAVLAAAPEQRIFPEAALAATRTMAASMVQLHARGWLHRDLKPGNVLCSGDGSIVLSDLEFATRSDTVGDALPESLVVGTPPFVAPELWRYGSEALSPAADVWALGVTLYLAVLGEYPFGESGPEQIIAAIHRGPPPRLAELPSTLAGLIRALLMVDPRQRPAHGDAAVAAIDRAARELGFDQSAATLAWANLVRSTIDPLPPPEPGTQVAAAPAPPAPRPEAPPAPQRPEGVGAASEPIGHRWLLRHPPQYFDISSKADALAPTPRPGIRPPYMPTAPMAPGPARATSVATAAPPVAAPAPIAPLTRRAAARWYKRMNPQRNFPLSVVFSGKQIRIVGGCGLGITLGQQEIVLDPDHPVLSVEPWFAGCLISPPRAEVVVSEETTVSRFWITPLVCGELPEACVTIRYRDKVVETLSTPARVVTRTGAKLLATLGVASTLVSKALTLAGWNPDDMLRESLPYAADVLTSMGVMRTGLLLTALLLVGAAGYFYITRPLMSEEAEPALLPQTG